MLSDTETRAHVERIAKDGYTVLERVIDPALVDALAAREPGLRREVRNDRGGDAARQSARLGRSAVARRRRESHGRALHGHRDELLRGLHAPARETAREIAARFEPKLQDLCGFGVYRGLIGHIEKHGPQELLGSGVAFSSIWEQT